MKAMRQLKLQTEPVARDLKGDTEMHNTYTPQAMPGPYCKIGKFSV
jgi:hypothetical protein